MIDHLSINVRHYPASVGFFSGALAPLGLTLIGEEAGGSGFGAGAKADFWIAEGERHLPMHIAFKAQTRQQVREFYGAAGAYRIRKK